MSVQILPPLLERPRKRGLSHESPFRNAVDCLHSPRRTCRAGRRRPPMQSLHQRNRTRRRLRLQRNGGSLTSIAVSARARAAMRRVEALARVPALWPPTLNATDERHGSAISERPGPMPRSWRRASRAPSPGSAAAPSRSVLDPAARCRGRVVRTVPGTYPG